MYLREAVLPDLVPEIGKRGNEIGGYFAYRFGHSVLDFIEAVWGKDAVREFVYEWRTNVGGGVQKAIKRAFDLSPEGLAITFRRYLRQKYLPLLPATGEPIDAVDRCHATPVPHPP